MTQTSLVEHVVDFYGDKIISVQDENGRVWIPLTSPCEALGIDNATQRTKVRNDSRFTGRDIPSRGSDGKQRTFFCVPLDQLQGWLFTINPNKIRADLRDSLIRYQQECVRVLNEYWIEGIVVNHRMLSNPAEEIEAAMERALKRAEERATLTAQLWESRHERYRSEMSSLIWLGREKPEYEKWADMCVHIKTDIYLGTDTTNHEQDAFALSDLFKVLGLSAEDAKRKSMSFGKLKEVKEFCAGKKQTIVNGNVREVNHYERKDWNTLLTLAINWLKEKHIIEVISSPSLTLVN